MKKILLSTAILFSCITFVHAAVIVLQGKYQDKNLYVQNGYSSSGVGFCTYEVTINGQVAMDEVNSSAFEIDFSQFHIKPGTDVVVKIEHKDGCSPKVLNPEVLKPTATFNVLSINVSNGGLLKWTSKHERGSLPYIIEQYRWNKWVYVGEVQGIGTPGSHSYSFQTTPHSGVNKYRVKQIGFGAKTRISDVVSFKSSIPKLTYQKKKGNIDFSDKTLYEIYDYYGNIIKKGYGGNVSIDDLSKGKYYLCYDNSVSEFKKR